MQPLIEEADLAQFVEASLKTVGVSETSSKVTADALVMTDTWGVFTHGAKLLPGYVRRIQAGGLVGDAQPEIEKDGQAWAVVNGHSALGQVVGEFAMRVAMQKAREAGVGFVTVRNSCHFGAAGYYASLAASQNLVGIAMANDVPSVAGPGSCGPAVGSNPFAYAIPANKYPTIMLDIAMSTVAGGKVYALHQMGQPIPDNWLIGPDGKPTTDASLFPQQTALAPMSNHKGYGLALMIEGLSALCSGAAMLSDVGNWIFGPPEAATDHGHAFFAIDVGVMQGSGDFLSRVDTMIEKIRAVPTADDVERLLLPGELEHRRREEALQKGIPLPADVVEKLTALSQENGQTINWMASVT